MTDEDLDYQIGASDIDQSPVVEDGEFVPFQMETRALFSTLAEDIYPSPKSGIREALTNSVTATLEAVENYDLDYSEAVISITVEEKQGQPLLIIEDNGIGMTMDKIKKVVSYIGRSTSRDDFDKTGQFGMGFLALFSLTGTDGGFIMHTNSRKKETEPVYGIWKDGGFTKQESTEVTENLEGTRFEIYLKNNIEISDVREWVEELCQWSRVPVLYAEEKEDSRYSDEFGGHSLSTLVDDEPYLECESKYYNIVSSPSIDENTILLDVPIENKQDMPSVYWPYSIRLKAEHPVVMDGKHEGKMVVSEIEYKQMESERRGKYVSESEIESGVPITPEPTGTREQLSENNNFWEHISDVIHEEHEKRFSEAVDDIINDNLNLEKLEFIDKTIELNFDNYVRFESIFDSLYNGSLSDDNKYKIYGILKKVKVRNSVDVKDGNGNEGTIQISTDFKNDVTCGEIIIENYDYVFMYINHINDDKIKRVYNSEYDCTLVEVSNSDWYDYFEQIFNWEKLSNVTEDHEIVSSDGCSIEFDVSSTEVTESEEKVEDNESNENIITIRNAFVKNTIPFSDLKESIEQVDNDYILNIEDKKYERLVYFDPNSEYNITDYKWIGQGSIALTNLNKDVNLQRIKELPVSISIQKYIKDANNTSVITNNGEIKMKDVKFKDSLIHIVDSENINIFDEKSCTLMKKCINNNALYDTHLPEIESYIVVTKEKFKNIVPITGDSAYATSNVQIPYNSNSGPTIPQCYLYVKFGNSKSSTVIQEIDKRIMSRYTTLEDEPMSIIKLLDVCSENNIDINEVSQL